MLFHDFVFVELSSGVIAAGKDIVHRYIEVVRILAQEFNRGSSLSVFIAVDAGLVGANLLCKFCLRKPNALPQYPQTFS